MIFPSEQEYDESHWISQVWITILLFLSKHLCSSPSCLNLPTGILIQHRFVTALISAYESYSNDVPAPETNVYLSL